MTGRVEDKVCLVTGGGRGIGAATAAALAAEGAKVVVSDLDGAAAKTVAESLQSNDGESHFAHDVGSEADWQHVIDATMARFGRLDVLVNNAAVTHARPMPLEALTLAEWRRLMQVNLDGVFLGVRLAISVMKDRGGSIINLSSVAGQRGLAFAGGYAASKGGVRLLTKTAALECAELGYPIRVNSVHPGFVNTRMVRDETDRNEMLLNHLLERHPMGRLGEAKEIAAGVVFLASDESSFMTGAELTIDGGYTAK